MVVNYPFDTFGPVLRERSLSTNRWEALPMFPSLDGSEADREDGISSPDRQEMEFPG
jgi:hypothetical protein